MKSNALIKYWAVLIQKKVKELKDIPEDIKEDVIEVYKTLPPLMHDPITETPKVDYKTTEESESFPVNYK